MRSRLLSGVAVLVCALGAGAAPASGQTDTEGGLQVDPGSPSGREYAIPLEDARRRGSTNRTDRVTPGARDQAPAFGEGVGDDSAEDGSDGSAGGGSSGSGSGSEGGSTSEGSKSREAETGGEAESGDARADASSPSPTAAIDRASDGDTGSGQLAAIAGIGLGVLLLGAAAGVVLRRGRTT